MLVRWWLDWIVIERLRCLVGGRQLFIGYMVIFLGCV